MPSFIYFLLYLLPSNSRINKRPTTVSVCRTLWFFSFSPLGGVFFLGLSILFIGIEICGYYLTKKHIYDFCFNLFAGFNWCYYYGN